MNDEIFRQKSLDRIKSPESLTDYIQVSNPSVWIIVAAFAVLAAGAFVWFVIGHSGADGALAARLLSVPSLFC